MRIQFVALPVCALLLLSLTGCPGGATRDQPDLTPAAGTITLDGKPLAGAQVAFMPTGSTGGTGAYALTDASGHYELKSGGGQTGAPVGEFRVVITKWVMQDGSDFQPEKGVDPILAGAQNALPPKYGDEMETKLTATVPDGGSDSLNFELTSRRTGR